MSPTSLELIAPHEVAFWETLGIAVVEAEVGRAVLRLPHRPPLGTRRPEVMHGGALATLIDAAAASALLTTKTADDQDWAGQATTDINVSYLAAATSDVIAEGRVLRATRRLAYMAVEVRDADEVLVAIGRATYAINRRAPRAT